MSNLHPDQFGRLLREMESNKGFSEHLPTATRPTSGFMVADYGAEEIVPSSQLTEAHLSNYAENQGLTNAPPGEYMGGWRSSHDMDYLDRARRYPSASAGMAAMAFQNQQSMYDASKPPTEMSSYTENPGYVENYNEKESMQRGEVIPTWLRPSRSETPQIRSAPRRS